MELSHEEEVEIPMPINSAHVGFHGYHHGSMAHHRYHHHHNHDPSSSSTQNQDNNNNVILPSNDSNGTTTNSTITTTTATTAVVDEDDDRSLLGQNHSHCNNDNNNNDNDDDDSSTKAMKKKEMMMVRYKECQKNHAACMGGNARDGCGEFMPSSGEEGSIESLICSVCNCHRNFHRKEFQGEHNMNMNMNVMIPTDNSSYSPFYPSTTPPHFLNNRGRKVILGGNGVGFPTISGQVVPRSLGVNNMTTYDHSNHHYNHNHNLNQGVKKRFRTKFSQEQKEKMLEFADKVGWKIQRQEENVVQQFCQKIGIKRRVLKVWMHNNKHSFAKKNDMIIDNNDINNSS